MKKIICKLVSISLILAIICTISGCNNKNSKKAMSEKQSIKGEVLINNYDINLKLDDDKNTIEGYVIIDYVNKTDSSLDKIVLKDYAYPICKKKNKNSEIISVENMKNKTKYDFKRDKNTTILNVNLAKPLKPNKSEKIKVKFKSDIPKSKSRYGYVKNEYGNIYQLSFFYPTLSVFENGKWNTDPYVFNGETAYSKCTDFNINLKLPEKYMVACSGNETKESTKDGIAKWNIKAEKMRDVAFVACDYMELETQKVDGIDINNYYFKFKGQKNKYKDVAMESAKDSVALYNKTYGKYIYNELDVVETYLGDGMEYPGLVMISEDDHVDNDLSCYTNTSRLIAHEIAHQWFYAAVGNDQYNEPWLDESFATFSGSILYTTSNQSSWENACKEEEKLYGSDGNIKFHNDKDVKEFMNPWIEQVCAGDKYIINKPVKSYFYKEFNKELNTDFNKDEYFAKTYDGGKAFLYLLRENMGKENFYKAIREYYENYKFKEATTEDFINIIKKYGNDETKKIISKYIELK